MTDRWQLSRRSYYADLVTVPLLGIAALAYALHTDPVAGPMLGGIPLGALLMSFIEYAVHRWLFHIVFRREHWRHHITPAAYIGVPGYQTTLYFILAYIVLAGALGVSTGTGVFLGLIAAYLVYIISHDCYHHGKPENWTGYWARQAKRHIIHHTGKETNFGVSSPLWDHILGTYTP